jgi:hypothetical protein
MLNVVMLNTVMLNFIMLTVVMLKVIMLNVVAPVETKKKRFKQMERRRSDFLSTRRFVKMHLHKRFLGCRFENVLKFISNGTAYFFQIVVDYI